MKITDAILQHNAEFNRAKSTLRAYRNGLNVFTQYLQETKVGGEIEDLTAETFIAFPAWLGTRGYSKKTIGVYLGGVKSFMDWLVVAGRLSVDYTQGLRWQKAMARSRSKRETKLPRFPKRDDAERLVAAVREMPYPSPRKERNVALVLFLQSSGCRNEEITKIHLRQINWAERSVIVTGKGDKERQIFFSDEAAAALRAYIPLAGIGPEDPLFIRMDKGTGKRKQPVTTTTIRTIVEEVAKTAGVSPFTPHYFRHAFAINVYDQTHDLVLVQDLLGHSNPATTRVYAKVYAEDLKKGYQTAYGGKK